jgi:hypothetical protein
MRTKPRSSKSVDEAEGGDSDPDDPNTMDSMKEQMVEKV